MTLATTTCDNVAEGILDYAHHNEADLIAMGRIVLTTDLSDASSRAFAPTLELARRLHLPVTLLSVLVETQVAPHGSVLAASPAYPDLDAIRKERAAKLSELASQLGTDVEIETVVLAGASASSAIVRYAREHGAAFIAIATHGRSGIRRLVMGSVAESVLRHARTPVIVFPPADKDDKTC